MKEYDAIVVGSGCGMNIVMEALAHGWKVALVDKGPLGGTCLNVGCIPSKMLIHVADRIMDAREAVRLGARIETHGVDFKGLMDRVRHSVEEGRGGMRESFKDTPNFDFFEDAGRFTDENTMEVSGQTIKGKRVFLASGARPAVPPVPGLDGVKYLTNETLLKLDDLPESLAIIGGGYVAVEYGHFFATLGTKVYLLEAAHQIVGFEEPEISALLYEELSARMSIRTDVTLEKVEPVPAGARISVRNNLNGERMDVEAQHVLVAAGRTSNADLLDVKKSGIDTDSRGYISVNEYMETSVKRVYAVGDAIGRYMFTHVANKEAVLAAHNEVHKGRVKMDYKAVPHAVYSRPQVGSVGLTEAQAREHHKLLIGTARYADVAKGEAMMENRGFAKAIVDRDKGIILGFHIAGPHSPIVIQEVINVIAMGGDIAPIAAGMHIHPELPEIVQKTLENLREA